MNLEFYPEKKDVIPYIEKLGFVKNAKIIDGLIPHFVKGNDLLFLIGSDYWFSKIVRIDHWAKKNRGKGRVYGVSVKGAVRGAWMGWCECPNINLLLVNPLRIGRPHEGDYIQFIKLRKL